MTADSVDPISSYRASDEFHEARRELLAPAPLLAGFSGASLAFFLAAWKDPDGSDPEGTCLIITATQEEADEVQEELETFTQVPVRAFPAWESLFLPDATPDPDIYRQRLQVIELLDRQGVTEVPLFIVAPVQAVLQPVPALGEVEKARWEIRKGQEHSPLKVCEDLQSMGLRRVSLVQARGEFSGRGDILDLFALEAENPVRVEFFGDSIESIRDFEPETQRSISGSERDCVQIVALSTSDLHQPCFRGKESLVIDLLEAKARLFLKEPRLVRDRAENIFHNLMGQDGEATCDIFMDRLRSLRMARAQALPLAVGEGGVDLKFSTVERFRGSDLAQVLKGISERIAAGYAFEIYCETAAEVKRFREILSSNGLGDEGGFPGPMRLRIGPIRRGFDIVCLRAAILTTRELFNRHILRRVRRKAAVGRAIQSFLELEEGDFVVHLAHGIGRFLGMQSFEKDGVLQEFLALEFREGVKLYVPVAKIDLVQKYIGSGDRQPILDRVGGASWAKKKQDVEEALLDLASDLLDTQAVRRERPGFAFPPDTEWQREFEASFPFDETPDQIEVAAAIKADMEAPRPMERLVCGDVGFGKTELAIRAAFKAVQGGKQVAVLVPTTVLAQQHYRTFSERMSEFPVSIQVMSRFRTGSEQRATIEGVRLGQVDILIGTHRILSDDVSFSDLGLVVIDEEQRFGVAHKERLKRMRSSVDVLTLTATPIPRTLHMSLLGVRDISSLATAPEGRMPVKTEICRFEPRLVREILLRELNREGQVYFVHNRIHDLDSVKFEVEKAVPEARVAYAHGQMHEHQLEDLMLRFYERELDVLISTTIIESGLDIPNVNTIFIDDADHYGLADLHQLRGRVGRGKHQAYCYLLLPDHRHMNPDAQKRVQALVEFTALGSGFQIAMRDLEIRGAGNILGAAQSGHISTVGYDMYCRLLEKAVRRLRSEPEAEPVQVEIDLTIDAHVSEEYVGGQTAKLELYRRISSAARDEDVGDLEKEVEDRFGPLPLVAQKLFAVQRLRVACARLGIESIGRDERHLILQGKDTMREVLEKCPRRVVVLDSRTAAIPIVDVARRYPSPVSDEEVFAIVLEWLTKGKFPESIPGRASRAVNAGGISSGRR